MIISIKNKGFLNWRTEIWKTSNRNSINLPKEWVKECIKNEYSSFADIVFHDSWIAFVKMFKGYCIDENRIFRGHSNSGTEWKFNFWEIQSSLNRNYQKIGLNDYLQSIDRGIGQFEKYPAFSKFIKTSEKDNFLDVLSYLQHYGIETPLVDFSFDPLTALFFAITSLPYQYTTGSDSRYIAIFELDCKVLTARYSIAELNEGLSFSMFFDSKILNRLNPLSGFDDYLLASNLCVAIIPKAKLSLGLNPNLDKQKGSFILLHIPESSGNKHTIPFSNNSLITIQSFENVLKIIGIKKCPIDKALTMHLIPYESIFQCDDDRIFLSSDLVMLYLAINNITGYTLFSDLQGFKHDFLFNREKQLSNVNYLLDEFNKNNNDIIEIDFLKKHKLI